MKLALSLVGFVVLALAVIGVAIVVAETRLRWHRRRNP